MTDIVSVKTLVTIYKVVQKAFNAGKNYRAELFLENVQKCCERMTEEERTKFKETVESESGQKITADFVIAVTTTPSLIVNGALALLYAQDPDYRFTEPQLERFVSAVNGLTDRQVEFYIKLFDFVSSKGAKPYPIYRIDQDNYEKIREHIDQDEVFIYIYDFLSRGLVITHDYNASVDGGMFEDTSKEGDWEQSYSLSDTHRTYRNLLEKAKLLMA